MSAKQKSFSNGTIHTYFKVPDYSREHWAWQQRILKETNVTPAQNKVGIDILKSISLNPSSNLSNAIKLSTYLTNNRNPIKTADYLLNDEQHKGVHQRTKTAFLSTYEINFNSSKRPLGLTEQISPAAITLEKQQRMKDEQSYLFFGYRPRSKLQSRNKSMERSMKTSEKQSIERQYEDKIERYNENLDGNANGFQSRQSAHRRLQSAYNTRPSKELSQTSEKYQSQIQIQRPNLSFTVKSIPQQKDDHQEVQSRKELDKTFDQKFINQLQNKRMSLQSNQRKRSIFSQKSSQYQRQPVDKRKQKIMQLIDYLDDSQLNSLIKQMKLEPEDEINQKEVELQNNLEENEELIDEPYDLQSKYSSLKSNTTMITKTCLTTISNRIVESLSSQLKQEQNIRNKLEMEVQRLKEQSQRMTGLLQYKQS